MRQQALVLAASGNGLRLTSGLMGISESALAQALQRGRLEPDHYPLGQFARDWMAARRAPQIAVNMTLAQQAKIYLEQSSRGHALPPQVLGQLLAYAQAMWPAEVGSSSLRVVEDDPLSDEALRRAATEMARTTEGLHAAIAPALQKALETGWAPPRELESMLEECLARCRSSRASTPSETLRSDSVSVQPEDGSE